MLLDQRPELLTLLLGLVTVMGLVLCLLGRRLARSACTLASVAGGGATAYALARGSTGQELLFVWIIAGGIVGLVVGWFLFRVWMGLALGLVLGLAASTVTLALQDNLPPLVPESARNLWRDVTAPITQDQSPDQDKDTVDVKQLPQLLGEPLRERLRPVLDDELEALDTWWTATSAGARSVLVVAVGAGVLIGLIVGLIGPHLTATVLSSLLGAVLIVGSVGGMDLPRIEAFLPHGPTAQIGAASLITVAGVLLQWTIFRRKTDK